MDGGGELCGGDRLTSRVEPRAILPAENLNRSQTRGRDRPRLHRPPPDSQDRSIRPLADDDNRLVRFLIALLLAVPAYGADLRILFLGNSLTYSNDLPSMVRRIGEIDGKTIETAMVAAPNYSLEDHLMSQRSRRALVRAGKWDVVVLQQGPSSLDESRRMLVRDSERVRHLLPERTKVAILMVWPDERRVGAFERVIESHRIAAEAVDGVLIPAGEAWYRIVKDGGGHMLYSKDGFHPTLAATYMVALATYRALVGSLPDAAVTMYGASRVADGDLGVTPRQLGAIVKAVRR